MKTVSKIAVLASLLTLVLVIGFSWAAEDLQENEKRVTITGVVAENFQIITEDKKVIEIGDNAEGDDVAKLVGEKVTAKGILATYPDASYLLIESYEVRK